MAYVVPQPGELCEFELRPDTTDINVFSQVMVQELYKPVLGLGIDFKLIIDCGANIGLSPAWFGQHFPNALIVAVEPDPENYKVLVRNTLKFKNVVTVMEGVWSKLGVGQMVDPGVGAWGMKTEEIQSTVANRGTPFVKLSPMTEYLVRHGHLRRPCLVKMDCEGAEKEVFKRCDWMEAVDVIAVELHGTDAEGILAEALSHARPHTRFVEGETNFIVFDGARPS